MPEPEQSEPEHRLTGCDLSEAKGFPSARWHCSCGRTSRWMQPQHVTRSHSSHRTQAKRGPNRTQSAP